MAKRTRVDDDEESDYEGEYQSDVSFTLPSKRRRAKSTTARKQQPKKKAKALAGAAVELAGDTEKHPVSKHVISNAAPLHSALLEWYGGVHEARGMPWRKPYDPTFGPEERAQRAYEVWISEIMLQQTQVATVIPYYSRWMEKFPTIRDLAAADIDTVNSLWKGLGYYSRAARLLQGAKKAIAELGGRLPDNASDMEAQIPGIGRYSAGAICSIAYNQCVPVLDGNVNRLMSRLLALHASPKAKQSLDVLWAGATAMVAGSERPGDTNQALIELGATICKVRDPSCGTCPLQAWCGAYQHERSSDKVPDAPRNDAASNDLPDIEELCTMCDALPIGSPVTSFPIKAERKKAREEVDIVNVVEWRHPSTQARWFLLIRRPEGGLLAGLHEFPTEPDVSPDLSLPVMHELSHRLLGTILAVPPQPNARTAQARHNRAAAETPGEPAESALAIAQIKPAGEVVHVFSHIRKTYRIQWVLLHGGGSHPPALAPRPPAIGGAAAPTKKSSRGGTRQASDSAKGLRASEDAPSPPGALWTLLEDVPEANIGTGVLKVWRQVSSLWASNP